MLAVERAYVQPRAYNFVSKARAQPPTLAGVSQTPATIERFDASAGTLRSVTRNRSC